MKHEAFRVLDYEGLGNLMKFWVWGSKLKGLGRRKLGVL